MLLWGLIGGVIGDFDWESVRIGVYRFSQCVGVAVWSGGVKFKSTSSIESLSEMFSILEIDLLRFLFFFFLFFFFFVFRPFFRLRSISSVEPSDLMSSSSSSSLKGDGECWKECMRFYRALTERTPIIIISIDYLLWF